MDLITGLMLGAAAMFLYWMYLKVTTLEERLDRKDGRAQPAPPRRPTHSPPVAPQASQEEKY